MTINTPPTTTTLAEAALAKANPFEQAQRHRAKLRLAIFGPSGSGKTYSALKIASGIGGRIAAVDTEERSMELYSHIARFDVVPLPPPYDPRRYINLIKKAEENGYDVLILDSLSHAWAGTGGILDKHNEEELRQRSGFRAWRAITPLHNELVDAMLHSTMHIIATIRSKTDYIQEKDSDNKVQIKKVGLAPIQREGLEYEFTLCLNLNEDHKAIVSKTRIDMYDKKVFVPSEQDGRDMVAWLNSGVEEGAEPEKRRRISGS